VTRRNENAVRWCRHTQWLGRRPAVLDFGEQNNQLLQAGLKWSKLNAETYAIELGAGDIKFAVINKGTLLAAHFGLKAPGTGLDKINKWNATQYFSRAYLDDEGDPALETELDLEKGVTPASVGQFILRFRASIVEFVKAL
jgi:hypothetical protein